MVPRGRSRAIIAIAAFVLIVANVSASGGAKLLNSRRWPVTRISHRHSGPTIVRAADKALDDELALRSASAECTKAICENARASFDETRLNRNDFVPDVVYPKQYERFVSRKNPGHRANRYKRYVVLSEPIPSNESDSATIGRPIGESKVSQKDYEVVRIPLVRSRRHIETRRSLTMDSHAPRNASDSATIGQPASESEVSQKADKDKLVRIPLVKSRRHIETRTASARSSDDAGRRRRSLAAARDSYPARRNASDYYAERRAVMARFYARQREIEARYGNRTSPNKPNPDDGASGIDQPATRSNVTLFRLYPARNSTSTDNNRATFRHPSMTIDPVYSNLPVNLDGQQVVSEAERRFGSRAWDNSNIQRQAVGFYYTTPVPCENASLAGTFTPKKRSKNATSNCTDSCEDDRTTTVEPPDDVS